MKRFLSAFFSLALFATPVFAQQATVVGPLPSATGQATTGQIPGTTTNDNAAAGKVGEYLESAQSTPQGLTTNTNLNVTTVSLTAGDWDVSGLVVFNGNSTTVVTELDSGISTTSQTLPTAGLTSRQDLSTSGTIFANNLMGARVGPVRISLNATTTVYLVARATFTTSTATAIGQIIARRVR